jgi:LysR family nitrogen assimilation transcriptional regulator
LDLRQLRYFIAIAEAGSFSAAAERLHIAQPALSQHVLNMEAELGARLLQRNPRGVVATEAGTRLLARARAIEVEFQSLGDHVRGAAIPRGQVRFGMPGTINEQLGVALIEAGRQLYPEVKIRISEAMSGFVLNWLRDGVVDVAMLYNVPDEKGLVLHHALTEEIHLFGIPGLKPWPSGKRVTLATALRLPLILPSPGHGLRELIETAAREIGQLVAPSIEIDSYRQICSSRRAALPLACCRQPLSGRRLPMACSVLGVSPSQRSCAGFTSAISQRCHFRAPAARLLNSVGRFCGSLWRVESGRRIGIRPLPSRSSRSFLTPAERQTIECRDITKMG